MYHRLLFQNHFFCVFVFVCVFGVSLVSLKEACDLIRSTLILFVTLDYKSNDRGKQLKNSLW